MKLSIHSMTIRAVYTVLFGAVLAACGGGGDTLSDSSASTAVGVQDVSSLATSTYVPQSRGTTTPSPPSSNVTAPVGSGITNIRFESTASANQTNVPVTFGQVFAPGHLAGNASLVGLDNGVTVPVQVDIKAKHPDGSVRHAILSAVLPTLAAGEVRTLTLHASSGPAPTPAVANALVTAGFTASFNATINGVRYTASADQLIKNGQGTAWLAGSTANEWHVSAPLTTSSGAQHPHLTARFAVRWYQATGKARVDVAVENNWAYEASPQNFTYDADFTVGGKTVYAKAGMVHRHHARWRKIGWWGTVTPEVNVKHNSAYIIASRAVPNYDQSLTIPESSLKSMASYWTGTVTEPMNFGAAASHMFSAGGRPDIGLLPSWAATYLLSMDKRARDVTLGTAELAGSWSIHLRDKQTGYPVSIMNFPYMTMLGNPIDAINWPAKRNEAFPACAGEGLCDSPSAADTAHQPGFAYLPYLLTGDYYYLEELQFWTMFNALVDNPYYRSFDKGLFSPDQVRGQAWSLRTLAEAAYITPDAHPLKSHFAHFLDSNLNWYNETYIDNATTGNKLGVITNGYALAYDNGTAIAPWQDDFFTAAVGHAAELGFTKASTLLRWKSKFVIDRLVGQGACWITSANYTMKIRDAYTSPNYSTYAEVYKATFPNLANISCNSPAMASTLGFKVGEIYGFAGDTLGYPANMQPAVAYAADINSVEGKKAWEQFEKRTVKPDYSTSPQFAIKPR